MLISFHLLLIFELSSRWSGRGCLILEFLPKLDIPYPSIFKWLPFLNGMSQEAKIRLNFFFFFSYFRISPILLNFMQQETRLDLHIASCLIVEFLSKHHLPLILKWLLFHNGLSQDAGIRLNVFIFSSSFRIAPILLNLV